MSDVAKLAGVSTSTVSRAYSEPAVVSAELRAKISEAAERLSYVPNMMAGSLAAARSRTVGIIVPTISNSVFAAMLEELTATLGTRGYQTMIGNSGYSEEKEEALVTSFLSWSPAAIVLTGRHHSRGTLRKMVLSRVPVVEVGEFPGGGVDSVVGFSHREVGRTVARHYAEQGVRRFGLALVAVPTDYRAADRAAGFRDVVRETGGEIEEVTMAERATPAHGARALASLVERRNPPHAVFCSNDVVCLGAFFEAQRRGMDIPGQIRLCGYGDQEFMAASTPSLSSVRPPDREIGRKAAEFLLERFEGRSATVALDLGFRHVVRDSG